MTPEERVRLLVDLGLPRVEMPSSDARSVLDALDAARAERDALRGEHEKLIGAVREMVSAGDALCMTAIPGLGPRGAESRWRQMRNELPPEARP